MGWVADKQKKIDVLLETWMINFNAAIGIARPSRPSKPSRPPSTALTRTTTTTTPNYTTTQLHQNDHHGLIRKGVTKIRKVMHRITFNV